MHCTSCLLINSHSCSSSCQTTMQSLIHPLIIHYMPSNLQISCFAAEILWPPALQAALSPGDFSTMGMEALQNYNAQRSPVHFQHAWKVPQGAALSLAQPP